MLISITRADGSGWAWAIPLQDQTLSCGIVVYQKCFFAKKKEAGLDGVAFYKEYLKLAPQINDMLSEASLSSEVKQASDWSYSASAYAGPHFRIVGDAGCFVDPYFSSGVHLALNSALAAAVSVQASRRGQCSELRAARFFATKVSEGYTRFLLLVMTVLRQLRMKNEQLISNDEEEGFDSAFAKIQPVIQGVADTETKDANIQDRAISSVSFGLDTLEVSAEKQRAVLEKIDEAQAYPETLENLTPEDEAILTAMVSRTFEKEKDEVSLANFTGDIIDGLSANLVHGDLGVVESKAEKPRLDSVPIAAGPNRNQMAELAQMSSSSKQTA